MSNFSFGLSEDTYVAEYVHRAGKIFLNNVEVGIVVQVTTPAGKVFWRITNYDADKKAALEAFFKSQPKADEVTFSDPYLG